MVRRCFGFVDQVFAMHPVEMQVAEELAEEMLAQGVTWQQAETEFRNYLISKKCTPQHIDEQMQRVESYFQPLLD